jgi:hypothetical protein
LLVAIFSRECAKGGSGVVGLIVVETVFDEIGPLETGELEQVALAVELLLHGVEDGVFQGLGTGWLGVRR